MCVLVTATIDTEVAASYGRKGLMRYILPAEVSQDKVEHCLVVGGKAHNLGEVKLAGGVADDESFKVTRRQAA